MEETRKTSAGVLQEIPVNPATHPFPGFLIQPDL